MQQIHHLGHNIVVAQGDDGVVLITRPNMYGKLVTHGIKSEYGAFVIAQWMNLRMRGKSIMVQDAFPNMGKEDREFLISGITPTEWNQMFREGAE